MNNILEIILLNKIKLIEFFIFNIFVYISNKWKNNR